MKKLITLLMLFSLVTTYSGCDNAQDHKGKPNRLIHESSPYLLQHAYNPVDWFPWGAEAQEKAKKENKPIIVSIGYSSCHWCHVMEHESFEDDSVAAYMNEHFVSIKVDREERPDIDKIYIEAAQMMTGSAGWPLNCITLPNGKPFFAGTYFPKEQWMKLLKNVVKLWGEEPEKLENTANQVSLGLVAGNAIEPVQDTILPDRQHVEALARQWMKGMDTVEGGYNRAPKFPLPSNFSTLLTYHYMSEDRQALELLNTTLTKMARGGIYDQIGGGFARYSTDGYWKVPHFEKMLYDNAQLLRLYSVAWLATKNPEYKNVVSGTVEFMKENWLTDEGALYSSFDADSEGEEGEFYVWSSDEIDSLLGNDAGLFKEYYNITEQGNWEPGKNILYITRDIEEVAGEIDMEPDLAQEKLAESKKVLLKERATRIAPGLDDKVLTSWNALAISGLVHAYRSFKDEKYLDLALNSGEFLSEKMMSKDFRLNRNYKNGKSGINGFLEDYAFTIEAFIELYQVTFDESWLQRAKGLTDYVIKHFRDERTGFFYFTSDLDEKIITRKIDNVDNVIPSANGIMARNFFLLGMLYFDDGYLEISDHMLKSIIPKLNEYPSYYTTWIELLLFRINNFYEVAIVGEDFKRLQTELLGYFVPNAVYAGGASEGNLEILKHRLQQGETWVYVCQQKMCKLPVKEVAPALEMMKP